MKKCLMCGCEITIESNIDMCQKCMYNIFGKKMADHIVNNFNEAKSNGNI